MGLLTLALLIDIVIGDPDWMWRRVKHPVVLMGSLVDWFDRLRDRDEFDLWAKKIGLLDKDCAHQILGATLLVCFLLISIAVGLLVSAVGWIGWVIELSLVASLLAQKSLYDHVSRVVADLRQTGVPSAREALAKIVGRDVSELDKSGICKASIESLAENYSDGVIAPAFWYAVAGLPGILFYKAVNTADSMIGHRNPRHEHLGKPAARLDDLMNWPAARLASLVVVVSVAVAQGGRAARLVWNATRRDAASHKSPSAGWPETSFAAALNLALGGPRQYDDEMIEAEVLFVEGRGLAKPSDIDRSLGLFLRCCIVLIAFFGLLFLVFG